MVNPARTSASRRLAVLASALIVVFGSAFALDRAGAGEEGPDGRRLHALAQHHELGDFRRRQLGGVWRRAVEHVAGRVEAGAASPEARHESRTSRSPTGRTARFPPTRSGLRIRLIPRVDAAAEADAPGRGGGSATPAPDTGRERHGHRAGGRAGRASGTRRRGHAAGAATTRRAAQSLHRRDSVVAGHPVVHVLRELDLSRLAAAPGERRRRGSRGQRRRWRHRRRAGGRRRRGAQGAEAAPAGPRGVDVTVHNLATGRDQLLGSVGDIVVQQVRRVCSPTPWTPR